MKLLLNWALAPGALILSFGSAGAQTDTAGGAAIRPMDIACQELMSATEDEQVRLVYFIAGYQAAQMAGTAGATRSAKVQEPGESGSATASGSGGTTTSEPGASVDQGVPRAFFSMPVDEVVKACTDSGTVNAAQVIGTAMSGAK
jgi:hypothetical protein